MIDTQAYSEVNAVLLAAVRAIDLDGCKDVFDQVPEETSNVVYPHVVMYQVDVTDQIGQAADSMLIDGKVPWVVMIRDNIGQKAISQLKATYTQWRRQIMTALHQKRFAVPVSANEPSGSFATTVDTRAVFDVRRPEYQTIASSFLVWCEFFDDRN